METWDQTLSLQLRLGLGELGGPPALFTWHTLLVMIIPLCSHVSGTTRGIMRHWAQSEWVSLRVWAGKRGRETHVLTAPDLSRCSTFSGLGVSCPVGSCVNTLSCGSFCVLCITTQHAHHKSLKQDPDSDLLTQSPATSSTVSPSGSCPPLSYHSGHHRETPGSRNGIPGVLDLSLGLLLPCPQGPGGGGERGGDKGPSAAGSAAPSLEAA